MDKGNSNFYAQESNEVLAAFNSRMNGLDQEDARERMNEYGANQIRSGKKRSLLSLIAAQFNNPVVYLLAAAAGVSFFFGDVPEGIAIVVVILLNAVIGFWMEFQARQSMNALRKMDRITAAVKRGGKEFQVDAADIVPGDIVMLESGNLVPADMRVMEATELLIDESPLTGESVPVRKKQAPVGSDTALPERTSMVYKGTAVTGGSAQCMVTATGMNTEIGAISGMVIEAESKRKPLSKKLDLLTRSLIGIILVLAAGFFVAGIAAGKDLYLMFQTAVAWTIAAIPEGLPIVASIALGKGMLLLAEKNVIVKKLEAVETLGETTIIFTDKTGTLTENRLSVHYFSTPDGEHQAENGIDTARGCEHHIAKISVQCNNAETNENQESEGDPLEIALLEYIREADRELYATEAGRKRVNEDPFSTENKLMGTLTRDDGRFYCAAKGACGPILARSTHILENGKIQALDKERRSKWRQAYDALSENGLRVLTFAFRYIDAENENMSKEDEFVHDMVFAGMVGFLDPPKEAVSQAISSCHRAGIQPVMLTGDHPGTAASVAEATGLASRDNAHPVTGNELEQLIKNRDEAILQERIFARVTPEDKLSIVESFQDQGETVAMTGDGVNDAPALKKADIGIVMGDRGTQVARETSDMVLKDDRIGSIIEAVREGRIIFSNIRKFVMYQLSYHLSEILVIATINFTLFVLPLLPLQLLFLNLLSDVFPALALGLGKGNPGVMEQPPKPPDEPILGPEHWLKITTYGVVMAAAVIISYYIGWFVLQEGKEVCNNIAFFSLTFAQLLHVFDMRDVDEKVLVNQVTRNPKIWFALLFCGLVVLVAVLVPGISSILSFQALSPQALLLIAATAAAPLIIIQAAKEVKNAAK